MPAYLPIAISIWLVYLCFYANLPPHYHQHLACLSLLLRQLTSPISPLPAYLPIAISIWLVYLCFYANLPPHYHQHLACLSLFLCQLASPLPSASGLSIFVSTPAYLPIATSIWFVYLCFYASLPPHCHQHLACLSLFVRQLTSPLPSASGLSIFVSTPNISFPTLVNRNSSSTQNECGPKIV